MRAPAEHALAAVARTAAAERVRAIGRLRHVLGDDGLRPLLDALADGWAGAGRVTLNFHPDRPTRLRVTVAEGLRRRGRYVSQFVTGTSNGGRSAVPGGDRDVWEHRLFGGAYAAGVDPSLRPVYGALDLALDPHGGSPRFGSCFVVLHPHVLRRATLCVGDSHAGPADVGTIAEPWSIVAALVEQAAGGVVLGRPMDVDALIARLTSGPSAPSGPSGPAAQAGPAAPSGPAARLLDDYVECQVHGGVDLGSDVEAIVLDPSFRATPTEGHVHTAAHTFGFRVEWHGGSELHHLDVPSGFRGPGMPDLARRVARDDGVVDAAAIGRAAAQAPLPPPSPAGDAPDSELQQLKYLWHTLLAHGHDAIDRPRPGDAR